MPSSSTSYNLRNRTKRSSNKNVLNGTINHINGIENGTPSSNSTKSVLNHQQNVQLNDIEKEEIESLVLWRKPFKTIYHALHNLKDHLKNWFNVIIHHKILCLSIAITITIYYLLLNIEGKHQPYLKYLYKRLTWCLYWCGLGILSSVGLGTGLHTFILYLGPHIASVTLAAYECNSLDFPEPPYPDEIICPTNVQSGAPMINVWSIMSKVRLEAFMWGAGTALGELPPYFISRAHRLSNGQNIDSDIADELEGLEDLVPESNDDNAQDLNTRNRNRNVSFGHRIKTNMIVLMKRLGFFGILACASIPNPLFDLAGIICGYSLISFWTFFGATLIGKAIIKMHIQKLIVIIVFNETYVETVLEFCKNIPYIGKQIHVPLRDYLQQQKRSLHRGTNPILETKSQSWISFLFESFVILMVTYFIISILNSMAQSDLKQYFHNERKRKFNLNNKKNESNINNKMATNTNVEAVTASPKKSDKND